jgi:death on curing protein
MTLNLQKEPKILLNLATCQDVYSNLPKLVSFEAELPPFESRFPGRLESILGTVEATAFGQRLFTTISQVASAYFVKMVKQHPFLDGNKRMAVVCTDLFLLANGIELVSPFTDLYWVAIQVAENRKYTPKQLEEVFSRFLDAYCRDISITKPTS